MDLRNGYWLAAVGRLKPGVTIAQANSEMSAIGQQLASEYPKFNEGLGAQAERLQDVMSESVRYSLWLLFGAVGFILLIACINVANLMLVRAAERKKELAVRLALGAGRSRIIRQVLSESLLIAGLGGAGGLLLGSWMLQGLLALAPEGIPQLGRVELDNRVLLFTLAIAALTAGLFALAPAWRITRQDIREALEQSGNAVSSGKGSQRYREALVVAQVALSLMLLIAAGLLVKSFGRLQHVDPGVRTANLLSFELAVSGPQYPEDEPKARFITDFHRRVDAIPGVVSSGAVGALPMGGGGFYLGRSFVREGEPLPPNGTEYSSMWNVITPGFIKTTGLQLMAGRDFNDRDTKDSAPVVIISQTLAKKMFPNEDPMGRVIRSWRDDNKPRQIVGIVVDVKVGSLQEQATGTAFVPHQQDPWGVLAYVVRTEGDPKQYVALVRSALNSMDPNIALARVSSMEAIRETALAEPKFNMFLIAGFSLLALILATIGLFGVIAYAVSQRTREIGIRVALGAQKSQILALVMNRGVRITLLGLGLGLGGSLVLSRALASILFDVRPTDVSIYGGLFVVLGVTAMLATYVPALRATRVEPLTALRYE